MCVQTNVTGLKEAVTQTVLKKPIAVIFDGLFHRGVQRQRQFFSNPTKLRAGFRHQRVVVHHNALPATGFAIGQDGVLEPKEVGLFECEIVTRLQRPSNAYRVANDEHVAVGKIQVPKKGLPKGQQSRSSWVFEAPERKFSEARSYNFDRFEHVGLDLRRTPSRATDRGHAIPYLVYRC